MFEKIAARVEEGRWEVTASQWVEGDKNMSSGESITRHLLYARAYFEEKFGLKPEDVTVDFEPDTFGHPATLPGILASGGVKYYYHCRGSRGPHLYRWVGPDGSSLLVHNGVPWYMGAIEPKIAAPLADFSRATGMKKMAVMYGVGGHGGGPTRRDLRMLAEMDGWPVYPKVEFSTLHDFFRAAEKEAEKVPEVKGERNFIFTGCYTSQARQKWANRHGENALYAAEAAAVIGERMAGVAYPQEQMREGWIRILFSQFHDILPGSGVRDTRHYTMGMAQESQAAAGMARTNALRALAERVDTASLRAGFSEDGEKDRVESDRAQGAGVGCGTGTGGESHFSVSRTGDRAFLVFNPLAHARTEVVEAKLWDTEMDLEQLVVTAEGAEPARVQVLEKGNYWGHSFAAIAFPVEVPALGYRTVCVSDRLAELGMLEQKVEDYWAGRGGSWRAIEAEMPVLENEFLKVRLDPGSGGIASLSLTLLRASIDPDPLPDLGEHLIEYALVPHGAGWGVADSMAAGEEANVPTVVGSCGFQAGDLPTGLSLVNCEPGNVRLVALKKGQDGGMVLRLVEVEGKGTTAEVRLAAALTGGDAAAVAVDALERPVEGDVELADGVLKVALPANGIVAVRIG